MHQESITIPCSGTTLQIIRLPQLKALTGLSKTTLYDLIKKGEIPKPIKLGARAVGWLQSDIEAFIASRIGYPVREKQTSRANMCFHGFFVFDAHIPECTPLVTFRHRVSLQQNKAADKSGKSLHLSIPDTAIMKP